MFVSGWVFIYLWFFLFPFSFFFLPLFFFLCAINVNFHTKIIISSVYMHRVYIGYNQAYKCVNFLSSLFTSFFLYLKTVLYARDCSCHKLQLPEEEYMVVLYIHDYVIML